jgi:competence ComEA-like helix-hairpin-helix protein
MRQVYSAVAAPSPEFVIAKTDGRRFILESRVRSGPFWILAAFLGCLFFSGWIGWHSAGTETLQPLAAINPNVAPKESLVRLPAVGPARAQAIIDYRQTQGQSGPAFRTPADLDAIAGIGITTVEKMMPWISFDGVD